MDIKLIEQLESLGCKVITGSKYCVVDKGDKEGKRVVHNLDDNGDPLELTGVCIISAYDSCKVYHGNNLNQLRSKIKEKNTDIKQGEIEDDKNIEDAVRDGDVHGGDMGRTGMRA